MFHLAGRHLTMAATAVPPPSEEHRVFIGRIRLGTSIDELKAHFAQWGEVLDFRIPQSHAERDLQIAFCTYPTEESVTACLAAVHEVQGSELSVTKAQPRGAARPSPGEEESKENSRVFVRNLPEDVTSEELRETFKDFGAILEVYQPTGKGKLAFITYSQRKEMFMCLANVPHSVRGQEVEVVEAEAKRRGPPPGAAPAASPYGYGAMVPPSGPYAPSRSTEDRDRYRVFVQYVPKEATEGEIQRYFGNFGAVTHVHIPPSAHKPGSPTIFAFVSYSEYDGVRACLQHAPHTIHPHQAQVKVSEARPRPQAGAGPVGPPAGAAYAPYAAAGVPVAAGVPPSAAADPYGIYAAYAAAYGAALYGGGRGAGVGAAPAPPPPGAYPDPSQGGHEHAGASYGGHRDRRYGPY